MKHPCARCDRTFADINGLYLHTKAKHGKKAARALPRPEREMSLGDELALAIFDHQVGGVEPPGYLRDMFPESFKP